MINDKELIEGCIAGKPKYQQMLYDRYANAMFGICKRYTRSSTEAEDMLQDVFVKIFLNLNKFRMDSSLGYWIKRLTINTLISNYRKKKIEDHEVDIDEMSEQLPAVTVSPEKSIPIDVLLEMVNSLPEGYRTVFNLREIDGYELQEIANTLNCTNVTVRSQLFKAKAALKKKIELWMKYEI